MNITSPVKVPIGDVMEGISLHVELTGLRMWKFRWWLARWVLWLGARVAGTEIAFDFRYDGGDDDEKSHT